VPTRDGGSGRAKRDDDSTTRRRQADEAKMARWRGRVAGAGSRTHTYAHAKKYPYHDTSLTRQHW
jgi:hypothetical protein